MQRPQLFPPVLLLAAAVALPCAGVAFDSNPKSAAVGPRSDGQASRAAEPGANVNDTSAKPNFFVIPIRTELQRELVANGKPVDAVVELNGYALAGKHGDDLLRAIDAVALRKALAAIQASSRSSGSSSSGAGTSSSSQASVVFVAACFGRASAATFKLAQDSQKTLEQACRSLAKEAGLRVVSFSGTFDSRDRWQKTVEMLKGIDLARETAAEPPVGGRDFSAFAVRTQVTRLLTSIPDFAGRLVPADCVLYIHKPLDAINRPMLAIDLAARIKEVVSKLNLSGHARIDYHVIPADQNRQAYLRNRRAIGDRFYHDEARPLTRQLGFKDYAVTY